MVTEFLQAEAGGDVALAISLCCQSFSGVRVGTPEYYALLSILPRPEDQLLPYNDITTVDSCATDRDGKFVFKLGESIKMLSLRAKLKKDLPAGVAKISLSTAQANFKAGEE